MALRLKAFWWNFGMSVAGFLIASVSLVVVLARGGAAPVAVSASGGVDIRRETSGRPYRAPPVRTRRFGGS